MSQESTKAKTAQLSSSFIENQLRSGESFLTAAVCGPASGDRANDWSLAVGWRVASRDQASHRWQRPLQAIGSRAVD